MNLDSLFDGSDAHELCSACGGTGRVYEGERCKFCDGSGGPATNRHELDEAADEIERLRTALDVAMTTLEQIATTPRNKGARRNAYATREFLRTQLKPPNALANATASAGD